jgi:hypothetical protein
VPAPFNQVVPVKFRAPVNIAAAVARPQNAIAPRPFAVPRNNIRGAIAENALVDRLQQDELRIDMNEDWELAIFPDGEPMPSLDEEWRDELERVLDATTQSMLLERELPQPRLTFPSTDRDDRP